MITIALLIGIYTYFIFILGLLGALYTPVVAVSTIVYIFLSLLIFQRRSLPKLGRGTFSVYEKGIILLFILQGIITLIGVLGPEIGFDALWYHLTLPKIYLQNHMISYIPGGLFYYSVMPKLTEHLYIGALSLGGFQLAKLIHFLFALGTCIMLFRFSKNYMPRKYALLTVLLFSSNLIVGWEAISAYVDLARSLFELGAFIFFIRFTEMKKAENIYFSALFLGLAVATKLLALTSLPIFILLLLIYLKSQNKKPLKIVKSLTIYSGITLLIPLPWFVSAFVATGNPFYPFLTHLYKIGNEYNLFSFPKFVSDIWQLFTISPDPLSPIYLISLPLLFLAIYKKRDFILTIASIYTLLTLIIWYFLPRVGGGRFILPYLPVYSFFVIYALLKLKEIDAYKNVVKWVFVLIIAYALVFIVYRAGANSKYLPYFLGKESKSEFLSKHLNFSYGDFYDIDGYFSKTINKNDKVLLIGFHNLYYVNFPFIDQSYIKKGDKFNYVAVQNSVVPERFKNWSLLYSNPITHVNLYSNGGVKWVY